MAGDSKLWKPREGVLVPRATRTPERLAEYAKQLSKREMTQVVQGFQAEHYEMVTTFVWTKAMASLKRRLATLGPEFIGEMLGKPEITRGSSLVQALTDDEALRLAMELGMFNSTHGMRLRHAMETVLHFADPPEDADPEEGIDREEALSCLRYSIEAILGHERLEEAVEFARFRRSLEEETLSADSDEMLALAASPYFFRRTTVRVLLALIKSGGPAELEHALGNLNVVVPLLWNDLLKPDRYDVGRAYAEAHAGGRTKAANGIRRALTKVRGFDYVPENLRSLTFIKAANAVLAAHFGYSNFHEEPKPMRALADLGTIIPGPAFSVCVSATLCVKLGNFYGVSWGAQTHADRVLDTLTAERWSFYFDQCLPADDRILDKLTMSKPTAKFVTLVQSKGLADLHVDNHWVGVLLAAASAGEAAKYRGAVGRLQEALRGT